MQLNLQVMELFLNYNETTVLKNVAFELEKGETLLVTGKNGSGKTSLLKAISGLIPPSRGTIIIKKNKKTVSTNEQKNFHSLLTDRLYFYKELTVYENIKFILNNETDKTEKALFFLNEFNLPAVKNNKIKILSSGMYQKLRVSIILARNTPLLLLDEPEIFLDKNGERTLSRLLEGYKNKIIIIASNNKKLFKFRTKEISLD